VLHNSVGSTFASCKAGPSSNLGLAPQEGFSAELANDEESGKEPQQMGEG